MRLVILGATLLALSSPALAQQGQLDSAEAAADRGDAGTARRIVEEWLSGNVGEASRSELARGLFLRARLMTDPDSAEVEYLRAAIDGDGPYVARARLRLGQLHLARGNPGRASEQFERLRAYDPEGDLVGTSWVWTARASEAAGDATTACAAWTSARALLAAGDPARDEAERSRTRCEEADRQPGELVTYTVQLGAFGTEEAAMRLRDGTAEIGVAVRVESPSGGVHVYRVRAGRFGSREAAELLVRRFRTEGFDAIVVPEEP